MVIRKPERRSQRGEGKSAVLLCKLGRRPASKKKDNVSCHQRLTPPTYIQAEKKKVWDNIPSIREERGAGTPPMRKTKGGKKKHGREKKVELPKKKKRPS